MAAQAVSDGSEDVNDFLARIKELGEKRDREDAERTRKLEEEIAEGRRQRAARRAERERSLSPEKGSPVGSPRSPRTSRPLPNPEPEAPVLSPSSESHARTATPLPRVNGDSKQSAASQSAAGVVIEEPHKPSPPPKPSSASTTVPTRSGTLSWQQRPPSVRGPRSRPISMADRSSPLRPAQEPSKTDQATEKPILRDQIAQSLGSKDPAWFRQTADRGHNSRAYRKTSDSQANQTPNTSDKRALPGLSREATPEVLSTPDDASSKPSASASASPDTSFERGAPPDESFVSANIPEQAVFKVPNERPPRLEQSAGKADAGIQSIETDKPSFGSGRAKYERSPSPTKGMGGFVESAMLKRSDSVNKRWSAQPPTGLSRQDSRARERPAGSFLPSSTSMPKLGETSRESSKEPDSRPGSSADNAPISRQESFSRFSARQRSRPESRSSFRDPSPMKDDELQGPPSPSKRFSPVKSSWLESALNKPEQSSPSHKPTTSQPSWMVDLNRAKQQRGSRDQNQIPKSQTPSEIDIPWKRKTVDSKATLDDKGSVQGTSLSRSHSPQKQPESISTPTIQASNPISQPGPAQNIAHESSADNEAADTSKQLSTRNDLGTSRPSSSTPRTPDPPSKKNIRSDLKSGAASAAQQPKEDSLEFQNVFGKLKRTKTQNYVAPDELKNNILRGKAGLAETGGPQKTARRDELKEDLLKQKEVMKTKAAETPKEGQPVRKSSKSVTPEAIAKKRALAQNPSGGNVVSTPTRPSSKVDAQLSQDLNGDMNGVTAEPKSSVKAEESKPPQSKVSGSSKFADRFNPGLANILARGPGIRSPISPPADDTNESTPRLPSAAPPSSGSSTSRNHAEPSQLQHMTKSRARGPKRRMPTAPENAAAAETAPATASPVEKRSISSPKPTLPAKPRNITPSSPSISAFTSPTEQTTSPRSKAQTPPKSPNLDRPSSLEARTPTLSNSTASSISGSSLQQSGGQPATIKSKPSKPSNLRSSNTEDVALPTSELGPQTNTSVEAPRVSVRNATALWGKPQTDPEARTVKSPVKLPSRQDPSNKDMPDGVGAGEASRTETEHKVSSAASAKSNAPVSAQTPKPTAAPEKPATAKPLQGNVPSSPATSQRSPSSQISEAEQLFATIFDEKPVAPKELEVDTEKIISTEPSAAGAKTKTLRKQINEITPDGRTSPLAAGQEHVLFSNRMYVCTHVFGDASGARISEAYLWAGSHVADSSVDEAQLFAKKAAKDINGKLIILRQGKESTHFMQALGGIVITRRGSANDSSIGYVLCGRQHLGHLAFDEVAMSATSLCAGFPFIIAAASDKVFLWKGSGCSTEELSGARLISMDLCPNSEVTEVDEGFESHFFLDVFDEKKSLPRSADFWKHKPKHDNYRARLFHIEWHERPVSRHHSGPAQTLWGMVRRQSQPAPTHLRIDEIAPFAQSDLESENIYVLDAFFEIYIIIGPLAKRKSRAFASALVFAQEYGILAASAENRPFVPFTTVIAEGAPRDMKAVFRTWDDGLVSTNNLMAGKAREAVGKSLKIVPLNAALVAVRGSP